jgi:uncharacterized protein
MRWLQRWKDVLFFHYRVRPDALARQLPRELEVDVLDGDAWLSFVLFRLHLRPAWVPHVPGFSSLLELNLRTYVRHEGQSGIYFLRMYADNAWAIQATRWLTPFDYRYASLGQEHSPDGCWKGGGEAAVDALHFQFQVQPTRQIRLTASGSLDAWLLERYRLFVVGRGGGIMAAQAEHEPWAAAQLAGEFTGGNSLARAVIGDSPDPPLMHYSPGVSALFGEFRPADSESDFKLAAALQRVRAGAAHAAR